MAPTGDNVSAGHSIPDNLVALLGTSQAWNCSDPERVFGNINGFAERENPLDQSPLSEVIRKQFLTGSFTARDPILTFGHGSGTGVYTFWNRKGGAWGGSTQRRISGLGG
jgi:hypothetical protein